MLANTKEIPEIVRSKRQKGMELRVIKGKIYAYRIHSEYDKKKKRAVKHTDEFLGRFELNGNFIPCRKNRISKEYDLKRFGDFHLLYQLTKHILDQLRQNFKES